MNIFYFILPFLLQIFTVVAIVVISWYVIRKDIYAFINSKRSAGTADASAVALDAPQDNSTLLALRLQAHERLIVFTDRLNPTNLFLRLVQPGMDALTLQSVILNEVRQEYQHNVAQQLYVSAENWTILSNLKEDTLAMINNATAALPADASGVELSRKVLEHLAELKENPYNLAIALIKRDIHQLF